jgi:hypothetical protein
MENLKKLIVHIIGCLIIQILVMMVLWGVFSVATGAINAVYWPDETQFVYGLLGIISLCLSIVLAIALCTGFED